MATCPDCGKVKAWHAARCSSCAHSASDDGAAGASKRKNGGCEGADFLTKAERSHFGAIVSFKNDDGRGLVLHRQGKMADVLRDACATATGLDPTFRVTAISTPTSVYTDLGRHPGKLPTLTEPAMLRRFGLAHLWAGASA